METFGLLDDSTLESSILKQGPGFGVHLFNREPLATIRVLEEWSSEGMIICVQDDVLELELCPTAKQPSCSTNEDDL